MCMHDTSIYPRPGVNTFEELYEDRENLLVKVNQVIDNALPTVTKGGLEIVEFKEINTVDTILGAFNEAPRPAITMFLAITGMSTSDVENKMSFSNTYGIADTGSELPHKDYRARPLAKLLLNHLTTNLLRETVLQQTTHRWTLDHRRHYRKEFEDEVLSELEQNGIPLLPDSQVNGSPDIAVPKNNDEMAIVGEIRKSNKQDIGARIDEFKSEIRHHSSEHPNAKLIVVLQLAEKVSERREKELLFELEDSIGHLLDGLYTDDDFHALVTDCQKWTPQTQPPLQQFTRNASVQQTDD